MTTIAELQTRMRRDLHDEGAARWTDTVLQRHLERAIREYSLAAPREVKTVLATAAGSRDLSIAGLTDMVSVAAVEWPVGQYPAEYVRFSIWQSTLSLLTDQLGDGSDVAVYWLALHADVRDHMFDIDVLGEDKTAHNIEIHAGATVFF